MRHTWHSPYFFLLLRKAWLPRFASKEGHMIDPMDTYMPPKQSPFYHNYSVVHKKTYAHTRTSITTLILLSPSPQLLITNYHYYYNFRQLANCVPCTLYAPAQSKKLHLIGLIKRECTANSKYSNH